jgi:enolase
VGDEGGFAPNLAGGGTEDALDTIKKSSWQVILL